MPDLADLFPGFASQWIDTSVGKIFARTGGNGPPLLLLHGYTQTNVMWHRVAPQLAQRCSLVIPDLPGYGWYDVPHADDKHGDPVTGARVLDLFAGTGALGIEAVSRGAAYALFVDEGVEARALLRDNVEALGLGGVTRIFRRDATRLGPAHPIEAFSLVFLDPPYGKGLAENALLSAREGGWLKANALIVVEESADAAFKPPEDFTELERRSYDDTEFVFLRAA